VNAMDAGLLADVSLLQSLLLFSVCRSVPSKRRRDSSGCRTGRPFEWRLAGSTAGGVGDRRIHHEA